MATYVKSDLDSRSEESNEDFYKATYSPNVMKISTRLRTVPTYALDVATIVAHIPWKSHLFFVAGSVKVGIAFC